MSNLRLDGCESGVRLREVAADLRRQPLDMLLLTGVIKRGPADLLLVPRLQL